MENKLINVTIPNLGIINVYFGEEAREIITLYENINEFDRQKKVKHLGLISKVFEGSSHSRYDYLMLQCALVDLIDSLHKGSSNLSLGNLKIDGESKSGNSIIKSWFLLSNFGHTNFTFGDEKAINLFSIKSIGFKSQLLKPIKDKELKSWCEKVIKNYDYGNMHYVIAIRRIYKETFRNLETRKQLLNLLKLLLLEREVLELKVNHQKLEQLKKVFSLIRKLSIISIDGHYSHIPINIDLIASIISLGSIEKNYNNKSFLEQIEPLISILHNEIYLNKNVLEVQRYYEIEAQKVLAKYKSGIDSLITSALNNGLIPNPKNNLNHFLRLPIGKKLQGTNDFKLELNELDKVRTGCKDTDYNIDYNPISGIRYIDFFINKENFTQEQLPILIYNISDYIYHFKEVLEENTNDEVDMFLDTFLDTAENSEINTKKLLELIRISKSRLFLDLDPEFEHEILPLYRELLWSVIRYFIKDNFSWDVDIQTKKYAQFVVNPDGLNKDYLKGIFELALSQEKDNDRKCEINQLKKTATRKFDGFIIAGLARITIFDMTKTPSERIVTDIDSVILKISKRKLVVEFNEAKNTKYSPENKAKKDLKSKFTRVLNENAKGYKIIDVKGYGGKLVLKIDI